MRAVSRPNDDAEMATLLTTASWLGWQRARRDEHARHSRDDNHLLIAKRGRRRYRRVAWQLDELGKMVSWQAEE